MTRDELIAEIERKPYDAQQTMLETFYTWSETDADSIQFRNDVADACAAYFDAIEAL